MPPKRKSDAEEASTSTPMPAPSPKAVKIVKVTSRRGSPRDPVSTETDTAAPSVSEVVPDAEIPLSEEKLVRSETVAWPGNRGHDLMDFSTELPKEVLTNLDILVKRLADLEKFVQDWTKISAAEKTRHFTSPVEEEEMTLWMLNAVVSLGEVYCRLNGLDMEKAGVNKKKELLERYARKFAELEPHSNLFARTDSGPTSRLDIPAVQRFLKPALVSDQPVAEPQSEKAEEVSILAAELEADLLKSD